MTTCIIKLSDDLVLAYIKLIEITNPRESRGFLKKEKHSDIPLRNSEDLEN